VIRCRLVLLVLLVLLFFKGVLVDAARVLQPTDLAEAAGSDDGDTKVVPAGLTATEAQMLGFERQWWRYAGAKEQAIRESFGLSATRYYQLLNALIDQPAAMAADPMLVKRLKRLRTTRRQARAANRPHRSG
jgi:hypothetical protein